MSRVVVVRVRIIWIVLHGNSDICLSCVKHMEHHIERKNETALTREHQARCRLRPKFLVKADPVSCVECVERTGDGSSEGGCAY